MVVPELSAPDFPLSFDSMQHPSDFLADFYDEKRQPISFLLSPDTSAMAGDAEDRTAAAAEFSSMFVVIAENATTTADGGIDGGITSGGSTTPGTLSAEERSLIRNPPMQSPRFYLAPTIPTAEPASVATGYAESPSDPALRTLAMLDFEHRSEYNATLRVEDTESNVREVPITVRVEDVLERPMALEPPSSAGGGERQPVPFGEGPVVYHSSLPEGSAAGTTLMNVSCVDPDGDAIRYVLHQVRRVFHDGTFSDESRDEASQQLVETLAIDEATGQVSLRSPRFGARSVLDFEKYTSYNATVRCVDRPFDTHPDILYAEMVVVLQVEDVVDLTIERLRVVGAQPDDLATVGGQDVEITGTGIGQQGIDAIPPVVRAFYSCEPSGPSSSFDASSGAPDWSLGIPGTVEPDPFVSSCEYEAANCQVVEAGTVVRCTTVEGAGADHRWRLSIDATAYGGIVSERHTLPAAGSPERP